MKTGLVTSDTYQNHNTGEGHPEKIDRVTAVIDNFKKLDNKNLIWKKPTNFDQDLLIKTHSLDYINQVQKSFPQNGFNFLDGDTVVSPGSKDATKDAVGSILTAIEGVQNKDFKNAFCAVRPPGAFFIYNGERYKILKAEIGNGIGNPGEVISDYLEIVCGKNQSIKITEIQRQGKKPQNIGEFMLGSQIKKGSKV